MKYTDKNPPLLCMMTQSTCYQRSRSMAVKGVLWHSTGANNPNLRRYIQPSDTDPRRKELLAVLGKNGNGNDWNHTYHNEGVNAWIGKLADGTVAAVQGLSWGWRPWGCGGGAKGSCNDGWIQFEICEDALKDPTYFAAIYREAVELTAYLCKTYGIDPNGTVVHKGVKVPTILCHADSNKLKLGSNHSDVNHWFPKHGKSMATVREDVAKLLKEESDMTDKDIIDLVDERLDTYMEALNTSIKMAVEEEVSKLKNSLAAEVAAMERRLTPKLYQTVEECPAWAQTAVRWAVDAGRIRGDQNGDLQLTDTRLWSLQVDYNAAHKEGGAV